MSNIAKRLCEAWVGATVQRVAPQAILWSPSFRHADGFGFDAELDGSLLLQCSWAQMRQDGPSTRVSRALVETYAGCGPLAPRRAAVHFVLVGDEGAAGGSSLYTIKLVDIQALVGRQGRGTVDARTLRELRTSPSVEADGPAAQPLEVTLATWMDLGSRTSAQRPIEDSPESRRASAGYAWQRGFGINWPSALAVWAPPQHRRRSQTCDGETETVGL